MAKAFRMNKLAFLSLAVGCLLLTSPAMAKRVMGTTPKQDGFRMPGEFEKQKQLQEMFPDRKVVGVNTIELIYGGGNIHCITQHQPAGIARSAGGATGKKLTK